jgi:hypothetical protein
MPLPACAAVAVDILLHCMLLRALLLWFPKQLLWEPTGFAECVLPYGSPCSLSAPGLRGSV